MSESLPSLAWRRSSRCDTSTCVEAAVFGEDIVVRDSKHPDGPTLRFSKEAWSNFVGDVRRGEFGLR